MYSRSLRILILPVLLAFVVACAYIVGTAPSAKTAGEIYKENVGKIVEVLAKEGPKSKEIYGGTGFFIDEYGTVVTAAHVVYFDESQKVAGAVRIVINGEKTLYKAKVLKIDLEHDIAILRVMQTSDFYRELRYAYDDKSAKILDRKFDHVDIDYNYEPSAGDIIFIMGFPMNFKNVISTGIVMSDKLADVETDNGSPYKGMMLGGAFITHGNSGGPVFIESGRVIGVATVGNDAGLSLIQQSKYIKRLLDDKSNKVVVYGAKDPFPELILGAMENA